MKTIVIDSGHGGNAAAGRSSPNAVTGRDGTLEKTLTLDVARRMRAALDGSYRVLLTRDRDVNVTLGSRAAVAQRAGADLFLALHFNGHGDPGVQGSETFVHARAGNASRSFASRVQRAVSHATGHLDRGVAEEELAVLHPGHHAPSTAACLTEISYLTDPLEEQRLRSPQYRDHIAHALAGAVREQLGDDGGGYGYGRAAAHALEVPPAVLSFTADGGASVGAPVTVRWNIVGSFSRAVVWPSLTELPVSAEGAAQVMVSAEDLMPDGTALLVLVVMPVDAAGEPVYQELSVPASGGNPGDYRETLAMLDAVPAERGRDDLSSRLTMSAGLAVPSLSTIALWRDLICHRPPTAIQTAIRARDASWFFHRLEGHPTEISHAGGDINLDFYPVRVTTLPNKPGGGRYSADEWLDYFRLNINSFIDTSYSRFAPYSARYSTGSQDAHWTSAVPAPLGAVLSIDIPAVAIGPVQLAWDDGSVCCTRSTSDNWLVSTVHTTRDGDHPVSGNRQFGYIAMDDGSFVYFTRGADRATGVLNNAPIANSAVFSGGHQLWLSFQRGMKATVDAGGGAATIGVPFSKRIWWPLVRVHTHFPTTPWI